MARYIWNGPGNLSISSELIAPGSELVLEEAFVDGLDPTVACRLSKVEKKPAPKAEPQPEPKPAPKASKR
jgi:hypothetical protein